MNAHRKAKKVRIRNLKSWRQAKAVAKFGMPLLLLTIRQFVAFFDIIKNAIRSFARACAGIFAQPYLEKFQMPSVNLSIAELRDNLGTDGASMPGARFTSEGGFSLN